MNSVRPWRFDADKTAGNGAHDWILILGCRRCCQCELATAYIHICVLIYFSSECDFDFCDLWLLLTSSCWYLSCPCEVLESKLTSWNGGISGLFQGYLICIQVVSSGTVSMLRQAELTPQLAGRQ